MPAAPQEGPVVDPEQDLAGDERIRLLPHVAGVGHTSSSTTSSLSTSSSRRALESAAAPQDGSNRPALDEAKASSARWMRLTMLLCLLLVSAGVAQYFDTQQLQLLIESTRDAPLASMLVFVVLFAAAVVLLVPGMLLSIGSGAAYGLVAGSIIAWLGTVLGAVGAFLLGRYLLRDVVVSYLEKRVKRFRAVDAGISEDGWKLVLLMRLSPVLPYNLMNYGLGVTAIGLMPYAVATGAAAIPYVCLFAYLGSVSTDLYTLLHDGTRAYLSPQLLIALACVMILSAVGLFLVCRHAIVDVPPTAAADQAEGQGLVAVEEGTRASGAAAREV